MPDRVGFVKDCSVPTFPRGESSPEHLQFGFATTKGENAVFYINLHRPDGAALSTLIMTAYAHQMKIWVEFSSERFNLKPKGDPSGVVKAAQMMERYKDSKRG